MADLSVLIPARNEEWLTRTVQDVLAHTGARTEVIVVLDGAWPTDPLPQDPRLQVVFLPEAIGQRAATNLAARISTARYIMKLDAHCALADGVDVELLTTAETLGREVIQIPAQHNLHVFDWVCAACGYRTYQGPTPALCKQCGSAEPHRRDIRWRRRRGVRTTAWRFDADLHFQYWGEFQHRPEGQGEITDTMSCLGACWFLDRGWYWDLGGLDEQHGSWGQMGTELACKAWLSGGRMVCNQRTWFAHLFRTQGGDFGFPYPITGSQQEAARRHSRRLWLQDGWPGAVRPLSWLIDKFAPVPTWSDVPTVHGRSGASGGPTSAPAAESAEELGDGLVVGALLGLYTAACSGSHAADETQAPHVRTKKTAGVLYYSDCRPDQRILTACQRQLQRAAGDRPILSVTLEPVAFGQNVVVPRERGYLTMALQILIGLELLDTDVVFHAEHDLLYHPSHFDFEPEDRQTYYYNQHTWKVDATTGRALFYYCNQLSGLCADRRLLIEHYRKRVDRIAAEGFTRAMGFEPGTHRTPRGLDDYPHATRMSAFPNIDIRHGANLTRSRWSQDQFRNQKYCQGWQEADAVPGWGQTRDVFPALLVSIALGETP